MKKLIQGRTKKLIAVFVVIIIVLFVLYGIPGKRAVREADIDSYSNYIIVKEYHSTGTGWKMMGGEQPLQSNQNSDDIVLTGDIPPGFKPAHGNSINRFLCIVEYNGTAKHPAFTEVVREFEVKEWYPLYPVIRNSLLPNRMLPKGYLTIWEMDSY